MQSKPSLPHGAVGILRGGVGGGIADSTRLSDGHKEEMSALSLTAAGISGCLFVHEGRGC